MQSEHKTQIYLSKQEYSALKRRARAERRPMAAVVREAVSHYLSRPLSSGGWDGDSIAGITALADGAASDSEQIDEVLYGTVE